MKLFTKLKKESLDPLGLIGGCFLNINLKRGGFTGGGGTLKGVGFSEQMVCNKISEELYYAKYYHFLTKM